MIGIVSSNWYFDMVSLVKAGEFRILAYKSMVFFLSFQVHSIIFDISFICTASWLDT